MPSSRNREWWEGAPRAPLALCIADWPLVQATGGKLFHEGERIPGKPCTAWLGGKDVQGVEPDLSRVEYIASRARWVQEGRGTKETRPWSHGWPGVGWRGHVQVIVRHGCGPILLGGYGLSGDSLRQGVTSLWDAIRALHATTGEPWASSALALTITAGDEVEAASHRGKVAYTPWNVNVGEYVGHEVYALAIETQQAFSTWARAWDAK